MNKWSRWYEIWQHWMHHGLVHMGDQHSSIYFGLKRIKQMKTYTIDEHLKVFGRLVSNMSDMLEELEVFSVRLLIE